MNNDIAAEIQTNAINKARREGLVLKAINDAFDAFGGAATSAQIIKRVPEILAEDYGVDAFITEEVIHATHETPGTDRNSIKTVVDFVLNEMRDGDHGDENRVGFDDYTSQVRVWKKGTVSEKTVKDATERGIIDMLSRIKANPASTKARNKAALLKLLIGLVVTYVRAQDVATKKALSKSRDVIVDYCIDNNVSIATACATLLNS